jgi:hypothetical protein
MQAAANILESLIVDNITVTIRVGYGDEHHLASRHRSCACCDVANVALTGLPLGVHEQAGRKNAVQFHVAGAVLIMSVGVASKDNSVGSAKNRDTGCDSEKAQNKGLRVLGSKLNVNSANHALNSLSARLQEMQRDFRRTIETCGNDGTTHSDGSVSIHVAIRPRTRAHVTRENGTQGDWDAPREADLAAMGVSAKQHTEIGMGRLLINFRRV